MAMHNAALLWPSITASCDVGIPKLRARSSKLKGASTSSASSVAAAVDCFLGDEVASDSPRSADIALWPFGSPSTAEELGA